MKQSTIKAITAETNKAQSKYGNFNSTHEAYAVLLEEVNEFWDLVQGVISFSDTEWKADRMKSELTQVASIATRIIEQLEDDQIKWV